MSSCRWYVRRSMALRVHMGRALACCGSKNVSVPPAALVSARPMSSMRRKRCPSCDGSAIHHLACMMEATKALAL